MDITLKKLLQLSNPWLQGDGAPIIDQAHNYTARLQIERLLLADLDPLCTVITGPRQAGKTTLGKLLCQKLIDLKRFRQLLYLNCDFKEIRDWLKNPLFILEAQDTWKLTNFIIFIDEVQRLENPGLLLKEIIDLKLPVKLIASGSSQLEIRSKVTEHLTGRSLEILILPFSLLELPSVNLEERMLFGAYPNVVKNSDPKLILRELYSNYINKDIIEILRLSKPDLIERLLILIAHSSGQLVNYNQLATDCGVSVHTVKSYLTILERTYVLAKLAPFVGNKRTEITSNPVYYFLDNGFRNTALENFTTLSLRPDNGLLVESFAFQEILKIKLQKFLRLHICYWRTKANAEVDFVIHNNREIIPIEVKYQRFKTATITRSLHSFIDAYQPKIAIIINQNFSSIKQVNATEVHYLPLEELPRLSDLLNIFGL